MGQRSDFQTLLETLLGSTNVYFQPPPTIQMAYPCIVYKRVGEDVIFAENGAYRRSRRYQVTVIDRNPDSETPDKVGALTHSRFRQHFASGGLNHDVYDVYF